MRVGGFLSSPSTAPTQLSAGYNLQPPSPLAAGVFLFCFFVSSLSAVSHALSLALSLSLGVRCALLFSSLLARSDLPASSHFPLPFESRVSCPFELAQHVLQ